MTIKLESYTAVSEAINKVLAGVPPVGETQTVKTTSAMGRVTAQHIAADFDSPRFPIAHMDGFAVIASDSAGSTNDSPTRLEVPGDGEKRTRNQGLSHGEAVRVSTGGRLPEGADAVVPVEEVKERGHTIFLTSEVRPRTFVYPAGADFQKGDLLLTRNQTIRAQDIGLLLTLALDEIEVLRKPTVAVLATGSELSNRKEPPPGKVRNTHGPVFVNMIRAVGCEPIDMGICRDDPRKLLGLVTDALTRTDMVLTLGGTSAGRRDLVAEVVKKLRPTVFIHGLRMDRGRVAGVALLRQKPLVMLPGPIQGAMNAFNLLGVPIMNRLRAGDDRMMRVRARMNNDWQARPRFRDFVKVLYVRLHGAGEPKADPIIGETESITVLTKANGYVVIPQNTTRLRKGDSVEVNLLPGFSLAS